MTAPVWQGRLVELLAENAATWQQFTDDADQDTLVIFGLVEAIGRAWRARHREVLAQFGLNHAEWTTIAMLRTSPPDHRLSPTDLRRLVDQTSAGMTRILGKLGDTGLVRRAARPDDGRGHDVILTAKGRRLAEKSFRAMHLMESDILEPYRAAKRQELIHTLAELWSHLDPTEADPPT